MSTHEVVVVGGGLLGRMLAWRIAREGFDVALYDAGDRVGNKATAWVAAGMIAPQAESVDSGPEIASMGRRSLALWPDWLKQLPTNVHYNNSGTLLLWQRCDAGEAKRFETLLRSRDPHASYKRLNCKELCAKEAALSTRFTEGLFLQNEGHVDNRQLLPAVANALDAMGVQCFWNRLVDDSERLSSRLMIDCRGKKAKSRWVNLRGVRGEIARLYAPDVELNHMIRLLHPRYALYVISRPAGNVVVGATSIESDDPTPVSVRGALELLSTAYAVLPELAEARILELNSDCRPALPDNRPAMRYNPQERLLEINGLYRHGFLLTPALVEEVLTVLPGLLRDPARELSPSPQWPMFGIPTQDNREQGWECRFG